MSRAAMEQALKALKDALSVCRSVSTCKTRRTREDGVTMYAQTEEWCRWVEGEVGPKVNAAGDALIAALAEQPAPQPLTDEELDRMRSAEDSLAYVTFRQFRVIARAAEAEVLRRMGVQP